MPSELETAARRFRADLLTMERAAASEMVRVYGDAWQRLMPQINELATWIEQERALGHEIPLWRVNQLESYRSLRQQVGAEIAHFAEYAGGSVLSTQRTALEAAYSNAADLIAVGGGQAIQAQLVRFNPAAVEALAGFASDGSPLRALFAGLGDADAITNLYAQNLVAGVNPRVAARELRRVFSAPLRRALVISRTEMIRSYRAASMETYRANAELLDGWIWLSAANRRTCAACWSMHGTVHGLDEDLNDHPQGRCTAVPWVKGRRPTIPAGDGVFAELDPETQQAILGPVAWDAYNRGDLRIADVAGVRRSEQWGDSVRRKTLAELGIE